MKPKDTFYISELSRLFQISVDSIRYYEKNGLLHPIRDEKNSYRYYTLNDFQSLVIIRELLGLGFGIEQIRSFLDNRTTGNTVRMLEEELETVNKSILQLYEQKADLESRLHIIHDALSTEELETVHLMNKPTRNGLMITDENSPDDYVDYHMVKYMKQNRQKINTIGYCDCYTLDLEGSNPNSDFYRTDNVFFLGNPIYSGYNYQLPAGKYLCLFYKGSLKKTKLLMPELFRYAKKHDLAVIGKPIELCHIDSYETTLEEEFLIEIELPVK